MPVPIDPDKPPIITQSVGTGGKLAPYYIVNTDGTNPAELWIFNTDYQNLIFTLTDITNPSNPNIIFYYQQVMRTVPFIIPPGGTIKVDVAVQGNPSPAHAYTIPCYTEASLSTNCEVPESIGGVGYH